MSFPSLPIHLPFTGKANKGYNMGRSGNGGGVITPHYCVNKTYWYFTYFAFGENHIIPAGTALSKKLKKVAEERREKYSNLKPLEALLEYAQDNESVFAITDGDWELFIEEMKEMEKEKEMKEKERRVSTRKRKVLW